MNPSERDKKGRELEFMAFIKAISDKFINVDKAPEMRDMYRLTAHMELNDFNQNRMKLNKIELFNLN